MLSISETHLSVLIPLLASKIRDLKDELRAIELRVDDLSEGEHDDWVDLQDMTATYEAILDELHDEYEKGLAVGTILPSFDELVARFQSD